MKGAARAPSEEEVLKRLDELARRVLRQIKRGRPPYLTIPVRTLANTVWDPEAKILRLGPRVAKREFFDLGESKRFMQTLLMLSLIVKARREGDYPTIRDLYYTGKHTIEFVDERGRRRTEETWDTQDESNSVIQDIEVATGLLREHMGIMHDAKGKIVGNMIVRSKGYDIDLSRLGSGAYAIPPNVDKLEILKVEADYVLVVEKDAIFERLNEEEFWRKHNCILVTGKGQPDRSTRRMVRRLWEEFGLPVYVLTDCDSIVPEEVVVVRDARTKEVRIGPIGELAEEYVDGSTERELVRVPWEVPAWNPQTGRIEWRPVAYLYKHRVNRKILRIRTRGRGTVKVTPDHSLFVWRDGRIAVEPAKNIKPGDFILVCECLPRLWEGPYQKLCLVEALSALSGRRAKRVILVRRDGSEVRLSEADTRNRDYAYAYPVESKRLVPNGIVVDEELAWLLGLFTAEGTLEDNDLVWHLGADEEHLAHRVRKIVQDKFGLEAHIYKDGNNGLRVVLRSALLRQLMAGTGLDRTSEERRIPEVILNSPQSVQLSFLKGLFDGDGHVDKWGSVVFATSSSILAKQLSLLLLSLGGNPTVVAGERIHVVRIPATSGPQGIRSALIDIVSSNRAPKSLLFGIPKSEAIHKLCVWLANHGYMRYSLKCKKVGKQELAMCLSRIEKLPEKFKPLVEGLRPLLFGDANLVEVMHVEWEDYEGDVYDLSVPGCESFIGGHGIVFHNSFGFYIYSVFKSGSISLSYESERLATPGARFIGVAVTDIDEYKIPRNYIIKATDRDIKRAKELMRYPWFKESKAWMKQLELFIKRKEKVEIEALSGHGFKFLTHTYLPEKIEKKKWII